MNTLLDLYLFESVASLAEETAADVLGQRFDDLGADGEDGPGTTDALALKHGFTLPTHGPSPLSQSRERERAPSELPR